MEKKKFVEKYGFMGKPFLILACIYAVGISSIIRADYNYLDDMGRVAGGYKGWDDWSRYLSNFLSGFIHADSYLTDVSPLSQLIAVLFLALEGIIVLYVISEEQRWTIGRLVALIPLGLSPYFLECISYKYDSPYMALSILLAVLPLLFWEYGTVVYLIVSVLGVLGVCTTYQAASGIYPMLVALLCMKKWNKGEELKEVVKFLGVSVAGYGLGMVIFRLFIMKPLDSYASNGLPPMNQLIPTIANNVRTYATTIVNDYKTWWMVLIVLLAIAYIFVMVRDSKRKKYIALPLSILTVVVMFLLSFGMYTFLESPIFQPRSMYGLGVMIAFLAVSIMSAEKVYPGKLASIALSWAFFVFAFTYGNALNVQMEYADFRMNAVIEDLNDLEIFTSDQVKTIQINGAIDYSQVIENMPQDTKHMLKRLIPVSFSGWWWEECKFYYFYGFENIALDSSINLSEMDLPILQDTMYHTIRGNENYILIELK